MGGKEGFSGILGKGWEKIEVLHPVQPYSLPYLVVSLLEICVTVKSIMDQFQLLLRAKSELPTESFYWYFWTMVGSREAAIIN